MVPAHAGVIPYGKVQKILLMGGPRTCGGDPIWEGAKNIIDGWSPHMRG